MATFHVETPDGAVYEVDGPDEHGAINYVKSIHNLSSTSNAPSGSFDRSRFDMVKSAGEIDKPGPQNNQLAGALLEPSRRKGVARRADEMPQEMGSGESALQGFVNWLPFGDELTSGLAAATGMTSGDTFGERYGRAKEKFNKRTDAAWQDHPLSYTIGGAGSVASQVPLMVNIPGLGNVGSAVAWGGLTGAGEGESLKDRTINAGIGSVAGGTVAKVAEKIAGRAASRLASSESANGADDVVASLRQQRAREFDPSNEAPLTWGQATDSPEYRTKEDFLRNAGGGPDAQAEMLAKHSEQFGPNGYVQRSTSGIADELAGAAPIGENATQTVAPLRDSIRDVAEAEINSARASDVGVSAVEDATIRSHGDNLRSMAARGEDPVATDTEIGGAIADDVRSARDRIKAGTNEAYKDVKNTAGEFTPEAIKDIDSRIQGRLEGQVRIDPQVTPMATQALDYLKQAGQMRNPRDLMVREAADSSAITGISPEGVETIRQDLRRYAQVANRSGNAADMRAVTRIMQEFDGQLESAIKDGMFRGDPRLLDKMKRARGLYKMYRQTFYPDNDALTGMRRILDKGAGPEEVANLIYGASRIGGRKESVPIIKALQRIFGEQSAQMSQVRAHMVNRMLDTGGEELSRKNAQKISSTIEEMTGDAVRSRGQGMMGSLFSPDETQQWRKFAGSLRGYAQHKGADKEGLDAFLKIAKNSEPETIVSQIIGSIGSKNGPSGASIRLMRSFVERFPMGTEEHGMMRAGFFQKLAGATPDAPAPSPALMAKRLKEAMTGQGSTVAKMLYTSQERAKIIRFSRVLEDLASKPGTVNGSRTAGHSAMAWKDFLSVGRRTLGPLVGLLTHGPLGALAGVAGQEMLGRAVTKVTEAANTKTAKVLASGRRPNSAVGEVGRRALSAATRDARRLGVLSKPLVGRLSAPVSTSSAAAEEEH